MRGLVNSLAAAVVILGANTAFAVPLLQIYMEGGTYDASTETWVVNGPSSGGSVRLWVIGNTAGPGSIPGSIDAVRLSAAYGKSWGSIPVELTPSTTLGFPDFPDPSTPDDPMFLGIHTGGTPTLSSGKSLPTHGIFGPDTTWQEFLLGDFSLADSPVADFINVFPSDPERIYGSGGQINVYDVFVPAGYSGAVLHFDAYDHIEARNGATFSPFSHDGQAPGGQENIVPEPSAILLWSGLMVMGLMAARLRPKAERRS